MTQVRIGELRLHFIWPISKFGESDSKNEGRLRGMDATNPEKEPMPRTPWIAAATLLIVSAGVCSAKASSPMRVMTGFIAHELCSGTFVSKLDPRQIWSETTDAMAGASLTRWAAHYEVDRRRKEAIVTLFGGHKSRAVYRDGQGCMLVYGENTQVVSPLASAPKGPAPLPTPSAEVVGAARVEPNDPRLRQALDHAFAEPDRPPFRRTHAVVIVKDGRVIAERYAAGFGIDTPIHGFSATKSVTSALIGILDRQGKLSVHAPAPIAAWRDPADPRHAITVDQLLRHTAGLEMGSSLSASLGSAFNRVNRMKFAEPDMAGFAAVSGLKTAPGAAWNYHDGNYVLLSRLIRDAVGGSAKDVQSFAQRELFGPLGMRSVTLEFDATGTPDGSTQLLASARDWARFGQLYLNDGVFGGQRILPEGWVDYSASPTTGAWAGMGAGFWINSDDSKAARLRVHQGMPREAFMARGMFGQYVILVPSQHLVIARFGTSADHDQQGVARLVAEVLGATKGETK